MGLEKGMKLIRTEDAVGTVLCHDITQIIPGQVKGPVFRKGHVVREEDIPVLLSVGKENLYVWEKQEGMLHENEGAEILRQVCQGEEEKMERVKEICGQESIFSLLPFRKMKAGIVTTGSEVYHGRIKDQFTPVVKEKLLEYGMEVPGNILCSDDASMVEDAIREWIRKGMDLVVCTGGMSVDPDDRTPLAIRNASDEVITYGAPVLPGAMFMLGYKKRAEGKDIPDIPVLGLPGCVMYAKRTIFDLVLPRIAAGERLSLEDFTGMGEGGLCLSCPVCTFPNCGFGK